MKPYLEKDGAFLLIFFYPMIDSEAFYIFNLNKFNVHPRVTFLVFYH
jgi:hypothetical protein